jgi:hypothetical protein
MALGIGHNKPVTSSLMVGETNIPSGGWHLSASKKLKSGMNRKFAFQKLNSEGKTLGERRLLFFKATRKAGPLKAVVDQTVPLKKP